MLQRTSSCRKTLVKAISPAMVAAVSGITLGIRLHHVFR